MLFSWKLLYTAVPRMHHVQVFLHHELDCATFAVLTNVP